MNLCNTSLFKSCYFKVGFIFNHHVLLDPCQPLLIALTHLFLAFVHFLNSFEQLFVALNAVPYL